MDDIFHVGGLKDLQALCACRADPTGTGLLGLGIPPDISEKGSPHSEEWLFTQADLSRDDLNNKNSVIHSQVAKILSPVTIHFLTLFFIEYLSKYLFYLLH